MSQSLSHERRSASRVPVAITIELRNAHGFSLHASSNLSVGGAFFDLAIPHPVGETVAVSFSLPGDEKPIICTGEVVNVPDSTRFGMGVRFTDLSEQDKRRLEAFTRPEDEA
jgi:uncharacterized protein (TIGR02266 family)